MNFHVSCFLFHHHQSLSSLIITHSQTSLLQRNEARRVGGTNTGATVLDGLVGDGELAEVVSNHFGLDFNLVEGLAVVDTNVGTDHLRDDDHVTEVGLDDLGLLLRTAGLLGLADALDEGGGLGLQAARETAANTGSAHLDELFGGHVADLLQIDSTVRKLAEGSPLLQFSSIDISLQRVSLPFGKVVIFGKKWMDG